ncbi:LINE-1 type transposase domain-containing protein 1 [Labeo rohita]|uniref:LINE-1 type transposase domain-containing protein 1 n=1 Tax=Labeo rohita TaxID=84645 RepID=A0ABQ8M0Z1_LABRO|nr:LINE-1 type transposase domain-containing protein 1 [Labeo rohita]
MQALSSLLEEHRTALSAEFKTALTSLEAKIDLVQSAVSDHGSRITSLESNADLVSQRIHSLEAVCAELTENYSKLKAKTADLEGRSWRNNIRIIGLLESVEGPRPTVFFLELLSEVMGEQVLPAPPELDRAHQALVPKPKQGGKPRAVIVRFHRYQIKEAVMREARKRRGSLQYRGKLIAIYGDYSPEVLEQRTQYRGVMAELYTLGFKPSLLFPARLRITTKEGEQKLLTSVDEAKNFLTAHRNAP